MKHHTRVNGLHYFGGKAARSRNRFIAGLLPWEKKDAYVEPFGGMMAVLLYRAPVGAEVYNDLNGDIVNWWRCVQECRTEFIQKIEATPHAQAELEKAERILSEDWTLTDEPNIRRGHAVYAYLMLNRRKVLSPKHAAHFSLHLDGSLGSFGLWKYERLTALAARLRLVQLVRLDAVALLQRCIKKNKMVIYVDPPYADSVSGGSAYGYDVDYDALTDMLLRQQGRVAVSGYNEEWDKLGWYRYEKKDAFAPIEGGKTSGRVEVLWCNYDASIYGSAYADSMAVAERWKEIAARGEKRNQR